MEIKHQKCEGMRSICLALAVVTLGIAPLQAEQSLPQKPIAAAALIFQWYFGWDGGMIEVSSDNQARIYPLIVGSSASMVTKIDPCRYQIRFPNDMTVYQINFNYLNTEYSVRRYQSMLEVRFTGVGGPPICEKHVKTPINDTIVTFEANECLPILAVVGNDANSFARIMRAFQFISTETCPFARPPF